MVYQPFYLFLSPLIALTLTFFFFCVAIAFRWRRRKWLAYDFIGTGASYLIASIVGILWFTTENPKYLFSMSLVFILFTVFLSSAILRILYYPTTRPRNWFVLAYLSTPVAYLFKPDPIFISLQIMLVGTLITFASFLLLAVMCKSKLRIYAYSGMLSRFFAIVYIPVMMNKIPLFTFTYDLIVYLLAVVLLIFTFYGLLRISLKKPDHFVCDYDHRKDR